MNWITPDGADRASRVRNALIHDIFDTRPIGPGWQFASTKLFTHDISPGCTLCGQGDWSCLFINGICNARCFYCPSAQQNKGLPMTNALEFGNARDYADYVQRFSIQGVSFSGGEPFLTFDRVVTFLKTLRTRISSPLYIWMYTNGLLVTLDKLKLLRDHGLDEIRFDISANHYHLDTLKMAIGIIPRVTVEIPAIPEDRHQTQQTIQQLHEAGVNYLNLHQLRCTPFNRSRLTQRGYTFLHGPRATVLETELTALELIKYSLEQNIALPINYCSFTFRHQFQRAGAHKRNSRVIKAAHEDVTPTGHIRTLSVWGREADIRALHQRLLSQEVNPALWQLSKTGDHLFFHGTLWPLMDFSDLRLKVTYSSTSLKPTMSFRHLFKEVILNKKKKVVIERQTEQAGLWLEQEEIQEFGRAFVQPEPQGCPDSPELLPRDFIDLWEGVQAFEIFRPGLMDYF